MVSPRVVMFGGTNEQVRAIQELCSKDDNILAVPLDEGGTSVHPSIVLFIFPSTIDHGFVHLENILRTFPGIPVLVIAEDPGRQVIIEAFRKGASDFLLYPPEEEEFRQMLERWVGQASGITSSKSKIKKVFSAVFRWFSPRIFSMPQMKTSPVFVLPEQIKKISAGHTSSAGGSGKSDGIFFVRFFGRFELQLDGKAIPLPPGKKNEALLAFLLFHHEKPVHREILMTKFWGETAPSSARNSLNVALHAIRRHFQEIFPESELIRYENESYVLAPAISFQIDAHQFLYFWKKGKAAESAGEADRALNAYKKAVLLYKGDFMEDMPFEYWCESERDNLREIYLLILEHLGRIFLEQRSYALSVNFYQKMLDKDPCLEDVHRKIMICYYQMGKRAKAIRQYQKCKRILKEELDVAPSQPTRHLYEQIQRSKLEKTGFLLY